MKRYIEATVYAADIAEQFIVDGRLDFPEYTFADAVLSWAPGIAESRSFLLNSAAVSFDVDDEVAECLVDIEKVDPWFFEACCRICAENTLVERPLPLGLRQFVARYLVGEIIKPRPSSRPRKKDWLEQHFKYNLVFDVTHRFDLPMTRNDASEGRVKSACDVVAEAFTACGRETKYAELKDLMTHPDRERIRKEFRVAARLWHKKEEQESAPINFFHPDYEEIKKRSARESVRDIRSTFPSAQELTPPDT